MSGSSSSATPGSTDEAVTEAIVQRARDRLTRHQRRRIESTDRLFGKMLIGQWAFAILVAFLYSPYGWEGKTRVLHAHVWLAVLLGGAIVSLPCVLVALRPGWVVTRHLVGMAQMLLGALLIHLSGGRIETHFHVFGSLAFLAFYLDWAVLLSATLVVVADHLIRQVLYPESIYGIVNPEWWRFLEHAFWVVFCLAFLIEATRRQLREWLNFAEEGGMIEALALSEARDPTSTPTASTDS